MDDETRAAFGRMEHWFELSQAQHVDLRDSMEHWFELNQAQHAAMDRRFSGLESEVSALRHEFQRFRDWVTSQIIELRSALNNLSSRFESRT